MDLIVQVRTSSSRLPNKILYNCYKNYTFLEYFYLRISKSKLIDRIIIATTINKRDDILEDMCIRNKWLYYRGSENDVLDRFYQTSNKFKSKNIIRITSDCPLVDYKLIDNQIKTYYELCNIDCLTVKYYGSHGFPDGTNAEIFSFESLKIAWEKSKKKSEREHVTTYIHNNLRVKKFNILIPSNIKIKLDKLHLSLDTKQDLVNLRKIINYFYENNNYTYIDILNYLNNLSDNEIKNFYI